MEGKRIRGVLLFYELLPFQTFPDKKTSLAVSLHHSSFTLDPYSICSICDFRAICMLHHSDSGPRTYQKSRNTPTSSGQIVGFDKKKSIICLFMLLCSSHS